MKKNLLIICLILICGTQVFAQKKWYVSFNGGYALKMSPQNLQNEDLNFIFINSTYNMVSDFIIHDGSIEQIEVSLGKGTNLTLSAGYFLNENFGIDMGLSYLFGGKTNCKYGHYFDVGTNHFSYIHENSISSNMFRINPSLVFTFGSKTITPYAKFGLILGLGSITYEFSDLEKDDYNLNEHTFVKMQMNGGIALGCNATLGLSYNFGKTVTLFSELNLISMSYAPKNGEIVEYTKNGKDDLHNLKTGEKEFLFLREFTISSTDIISDNEPTKMLNYRYPFSSIGFNLGIRINF